MIRINENYLKLQASYLFSEIARRISAFQEVHPEREIIKLGIGDVTKALPPACVEAFHQAVDEMAEDRTFRGYGPEQGYPFLRNKIAAEDFQARGADVGEDEIFISDGYPIGNNISNRIFVWRKIYSCKRCKHCCGNKCYLGSDYIIFIFKN